MSALRNTSSLLPWGATVTPISPDIRCPSPRRILATFAIVNVVTALSCVFGNRRVLNWMTNGRFFKNPDSKTHRIWWIVVVGLQLSANALVGYLFHNSPGYHTDLTVWQLMLLFTVRPRLSWIAMLALGMIHTPKRSHELPALQSVDEDEELIANYDRDSPAKEIQEKRKKRERLLKLKRTEWPWSSSAKSQAYAEIALQAISLVVVGRIVHSAVRNKFYILHSPSYKEIPFEAHLMYGGALYYLISCSVLIFYEICFICGTYMDGAKDDGREKLEEWEGYAGMFITYNLITSWLASWLFWAGFVKLAHSENLYCAPKLFAQGSIWGAFSFLGILIGAGGG